jgi:hypothetical protein
MWIDLAWSCFDVKLSVQSGKQYRRSNRAAVINLVRNVPMLEPFSLGIVGITTLLCGATSSKEVGIDLPWSCFDASKADLEIRVICLRKFPSLVPFSLELVRLATLLFASVPWEMLQ